MNTRRYPLLFLLASWVAGAIGFVLGLLLDPNVFARMGSMVVLFALMSEYSLLKQELNLLYVRLENDSGSRSLKPSRWHEKHAYAAHITVVMGTLIWGFGDLPLQWVH